MSRLTCFACTLLIIPSAQALALLIAGGGVWRFYWRTVQREALSVPEERASGLRKLYLYGTLALSLLGALILLQQVLSEFFVRLLDTGLNGYKPWTPLLIVVLLGLNWRWHDRVTRADEAANAEGTRGADLDRGYWFSLSYFGILTATNGLVLFLSGLLSHLGGRAPATLTVFGGGSWIQTLIPPLMQILVSAFAIGWFWLPSQKAATSGDEEERASRARSWLIHVIVFSAAISALGGAQGVLTDVLSRLLTGFPGDLLVLTINGPLASFIVGGLLLWYFFKQVRPTLPSPRLSEYILAGVALFIAVLGVVQLIAALFRVLGGQGPRIEVLLANVLPPLLIGGAVWRWRWRWIEAEVSGAEGSTARSNLWRKVYLYLFQLIGLVMILVGAVTLLGAIIAAILGQPLTGNVFSELADPLAFLLAGSGLMIYMLQLVASDARLGALSVEETMRQTLGDTAPTWAIAAVAGFVLGPVFLIVVLAALGPTISNIFNNIIRGIQ